MMSFRMTMSRVAVPALVGAAAFAASALADGPAVKAALLPDASIVIHEANGKSTVIPINQKLAEMLLNDPQAKPLQAGIIVFTANNQTYMIADHTMKNGDTMIAAILRDYVPAQGGG
jgi:hypothetical protein